MQRILFSPLGDTDPVRGFHDGACLHIIRHYQPEKVVLFYTADMEEKERQDHRFTKAILKLVPNIEIEQDFSHITEPHIYDNFRIFQELVAKLHENYPKAEILLNLSSGTPQMKTMLAMLSLEEPWCRGIQVASPEKGSNRNNHAHVSDDIDTLLELNEDDAADASNRCLEPPLRIFRINNERQRLASLLNNYEYKSALDLLVDEHSVLKNKKAEKWLKHADARRDFRLKDAMEGEGVKYFLFQQNQKYPTKATELTEYFLQIHIEQKKGNLAGVLLKSIPFMYELLLEYVEQNPAVSLTAFCERRTQAPAGSYKIVEENMRKIFPKLAELFYANCNYVDGVDLSFYHLFIICRYLQQEGLAADKEKNDAILNEIVKIEDYRWLRNNIAHTLSYVDEDKFKQKLHLSSTEFVDCMGRILQLLYGEEKIEKLRGTYDWLNSKIMQELKGNAQK